VGDERPRRGDPDRFLEIYMRDQLALGIGWRELSRRAALRNRGTALGDALEEARRGIAGDVYLFERLMRSLGFAPSKVKNALAVVGERLARLKPNGRLVRHSPLSRFEELDALLMGIDGKVTLWTTLRDEAGLAERLPSLDFDELLARARSQRSTLEPHHRWAARRAFATPSSSVRSGRSATERTRDAEETDVLVDLTSEQSFPASDAPSFWARGST
jgi:hypothetical protein